jgi:hypothetical protein
MAKYAKFISEDCIKYAPRTLKTTEFICFNFDKASPEILNSRGYFEVIEDEVTEVNEGMILRPTYEDCGDHIQVHWVEEEVEEEGEGD